MILTSRCCSKQVQKFSPVWESLLVSISALPNCVYVESVVKGNSETTEELTDWHGGLTTILFYKRLKHNF